MTREPRALLANSEPGHASPVLPYPQGPRNLNPLDDIRL